MGGLRKTCGTLKNLQSNLGPDIRGWIKITLPRPGNRIGHPVPLAQGDLDLRLVAMATPIVDNAGKTVKTSGDTSGIGAKASAARRGRSMPS